MAVITGAIILLLGLGAVGEVTENHTHEGDDDLTERGTETLKSM